MGCLKTFPRSSISSSESNVPERAKWPVFSRTQLAGFGVITEGSGSIDDYMPAQIGALVEPYIVPAYAQKVQYAVEALCELLQ